MRWALMYESFISLSLELAFLPPLAPSHVGEQVTRFFNPTLVTSFGDTDELLNQEDRPHRPTTHLL